MSSADVESTPLDQLDVSRPELFQQDNWQPWFARLRREAPVHYLSDSVNGPFWSVTSHELIKEVDSNHLVFSSEKGGIVIVDPYVTEPGQLENRTFGIRSEPPQSGRRVRTQRR